MTAIYNPAEVERLVAEAREDDARMTQGPWTEPDGNRLRGAVNALVGGVHRQVAQASAEAPSAEDDLDCGPLDIAGPRLLANASGIARTRNNLRAMADQLEAARAEVDRLTECMRVAGLQCFMRHGAPEKVAEHLRMVAASWTEHEAKLATERDAARTEVHQLRARVAELEARQP